ncbi:MAG: DUF1284 domain-containing protein [Myxococcales bacterium]|nr:DUF1284 domain-containing protein [Myxococcales bacterium]USN50287.1 MAG: DUF1284 domain-containing protein [Myxococcales bacterium]
MIQFRPHHFLCSIAYKGLGYSPTFIKNFDGIAQTIRSDEDTQIQVVIGIDSICTACPHQRPQTRTCNSEKKIAKLDRAHAEILDLSNKDVLTFREAKARISKYMSLQQFRKACSPCEWQKMGVCEDALSKLKSDDDTNSRI